MAKDEVYAEKNARNSALGMIRKYIANVFAQSNLKDCQVSYGPDAATYKALFHNTVETPVYEVRKLTYWVSNDHRVHSRVDIYMSFERKEDAQKRFDEIEFTNQ